MSGKKGHDNDIKREEKLEKRKRNSGKTEEKEIEEKEGQEEFL